MLLVCFLLLQQNTGGRASHKQKGSVWFNGCVPQPSGHTRRWPSVWQSAELAHGTRWQKIRECACVSICPSSYRATNTESWGSTLTTSAILSTPQGPHSTPQQTSFLTSQYPLNETKPAGGFTLRQWLSTLAICLPNREL